MGVSLLVAPAAPRREAWDSAARHAAVRPDLDPSRVAVDPEALALAALSPSSSV
jgi:hypothetical protein